MKLTQRQIDRLVQGKTVQVRRLVKEDEFFVDHTWNVKTKQFTDAIWLERGEDKNRIKWQVGRDYAIAKPGRWYCPKCKKVTGAYDGNMTKNGTCNNCLETKIKPLCFKVASIRKERLLDSRDDDFIDAFYRINNIYAPKENKLRMSLKELEKYKFKPLKFGSYLYSKNYVTILSDWNPEVWVLEGVKK